MREDRISLYREFPGESWDDVMGRVEVALKEEGFGILTRIDVRATLKEKLDLDFRPYEILGACNPALAHRALSADDTIGVMLPCNVVVAESDGGIEVAIARPSEMLRVADAQGLAAVADEAEERLARALAAI
ncbi:MAG: DUF302 domain-containing protein [Gemmatimonadota bacterium]|nr:DUF302 domain-containing protein [Gemmatimonadota bacterium]